MGARSGLLHVTRGDQNLDIDFHGGEITGLRGPEGRALLLEALSWCEGSYWFDEKSVTPEEQRTVSDLSMPELICESVRRLEDSDMVRYALGDLDRVLVVRGVAGPGLALQRADELVLSRVDGIRSSREVIQLVPLPAEQTQRIILGLVCTGVLAFDLPSEASEEAADAGGAQPAPRATGREAPEGHERFDALDHLEAMGIPRGQLPEDPVENALLADDVIRKAAHLVSASDNWSAIQLLEAAIPRIHARELKHEAQVVLARACSRNPKWVKRGEHMLLSVVREDPACLEAYFELGMLYKELGLKARALAMFRKVTELKPGHALAASEIRSLNPPHRKFF